ncbi:MAG: hypothetical protein IPJ89_02145 [Candidatus Iainarchaeum archaeon]|uniref:Core-binding (CB) domain-containing protein n=1 Tax=Candidatus Iainarchaeum sp. TaxID=3101447 RepID=A0A7T9I2G5_9ARCH|nr:MAG: hypothetical protein IPJ89_02145 [Candidatus Diapherotrites archaeon]
MAAETTFHNYERQYELLLNRIYPEKYPCKTISNKGFGHTSYNLSLPNKKIIDKYRMFLENQGGKSIARRKRILHIIADLGNMLKKDFESAKKEDIEELVSKIMNFSTWNETTKSMYKQNLKTFYKWLKGESEFFPPEVSWIKITKVQEYQKLPEDMLTEEEIKKIFEAAGIPCRGTRDISIRKRDIYEHERENTKHWRGH